MEIKQTQRLLTRLENIEKAMAGIYERFSKSKGFTAPVKEFWDQMTREELFHASVFREMSEKIRQDAAILIEIDIDILELNAFVEKTRALLEETTPVTITEEQAYTLGALIEAELNESRFLEKIRSPDPNLADKIQKIRNDTKKHNLILVNYSKGIL